ncbi:MAG: 50S ribosomal protein L24e [Nanoarchaeota archaeon]
MAKCSFCGVQIDKGTGKMYVYVNGKIDHFCSNKCEKNQFKLGRKPVDMRWTEASKLARKSEKKQGA